MFASRCIMCRMTIEISMLLSCLKVHMEIQQFNAKHIKHSHAIQNTYMHL